MLDHNGHTLKLIEEEAEVQTIEMKALIQEQRQNLQEKMNLVSELDEDYAKLVQQSENLIRDVETFADDLMKTIEAKKQNIISAVENETRKSLESLTKKRTEIEEEIKTIELSLEKVENLLTRSTNAEVIQLKKSLETIIEGVKQTKLISRDPEGVPPLVFVENHKMLDIVNGGEIGFLENPRQAKGSNYLAEGKGIREGTVGREAQFNLTTRNANKRQCYNNRDNVTVEMRDERGRECVTKVQIDDNKDGSYTICYSPTVPGRCYLSIKVNEKHICNSPFSVLVKPLLVNLL